MTLLHRFLRILPFLSLTLGLGVLSSCETVSFYTQAARGQAEISFCKRAIPKVLADPTTEPAVATKLKLSQEIVAFAEAELALKSNGSYRHYTDLQRDSVSHIVYAAGEFSLEGKTWWYPIVGPQDYRAYFKEATADKLINKLAAQGYDTFKGGVSAYSTLGFLNDPILNTFIAYPDTAFAELLFHEMTHQRFYKPKDTAFNEALAEVVAREGTRRWLRSRGDQKALATYELSLQRRAAIRKEILATITRLKALYASGISAEQMRASKKKELENLRKEIKALYAGWQQTPTHFLSTPLNNARLVAFTTYEELVPEFEKRLAAHNFDLDSFLTEIENNDR